MSTFILGSAAGVIAFVGGSVVAVYGVSYIADKFFSVTPGVLLLNRGSAYGNNGIIARKAGLSGMTVDERNAVLNEMFPTTSYCKNPENKDTELTALKENDEEDIELGKSSEFEDTDLGGNDKDLLKQKQNQDDELSIKSQEKASYCSGGEEEEDKEKKEDPDYSSSKDDDTEKNDATHEEVATETTVDMEEKKDGFFQNLTGSFYNNTKSETDPISNASDDKESKTVIEDETCAICMEDYEDGDDVITGKNCTHIFHRECILEWLGKASNELCPVCREEMLTMEGMQKAAKKVLSEERIAELKELTEAEEQASEESETAEDIEQESEESEAAEDIEDIEAHQEQSTQLDSEAAPVITALDR
jgi:hypothetical protein